MMAVTGTECTMQTAARSRPLPLVIAASALCAVSMICLPAASQTFQDAPIPCGTGTPYKSCTASFDGRHLRVHYRHPEGKDSVATYRKCHSGPSEIHCVEGEWSSDSGKGPIGARSIGLRDGLPFRN
jgi:hypothetical protein